MLLRTGSGQAGSEIGGKTVDGTTLTTLTTSQQISEICNDRQAILSHGLKPFSFAYPGGAFSTTIESEVQNCGYGNARTAGSLSPAGTVYAETLPPKTWLALRAYAPTGQVTLANLEALVSGAASHGGGWVPIGIQKVCSSTQDPSNYTACTSSAGWIDLGDLNTFLGWVQNAGLSGGAPTGTAFSTMGAEAASADTVAPATAISCSGSPCQATTYTSTVSVTLAPTDTGSQVHQNLVDHGFYPTSFAYPFGAYNATAEGIVQNCGYTSGRAAGGIDVGGVGAGPVYAETIPAKDQLATRTVYNAPAGNPPNVPPLQLSDMQAAVTAASQNGGGWIRLAFHQVCSQTYDPGNYTECLADWGPVELSTLNSLLDWLQNAGQPGGAPAGTTMKTVSQVINGADTQPPITTLECDGSPCQAAAYNGSTTVSLFAKDPGGSGVKATYYTTDGSTPTTSSPLAGQPFTINHPMTFKFFSVDNAGNTEAVKTQTVQVQPNPDGAFGSALPAGVKVNAATGYYSYNLGSWHIIALNTAPCALSTPSFCAAGSAQEQWLQQDLASNTAACTLAYFQNPRWASTASGSGGSTTYQQFWQDLYKGGAEVVLDGDSHWYERFAPLNTSGAIDNTYGVREFIVGTGGAGLEPPGTEVATSQVLNATTHGVIKLTLHNGSYDWQFLNDGETAFTDSGSTTCHSKPPA